MNYDAIEQASTVIVSNFTADMAAIITDKSLGALGLSTAFTMHKRFPMEWILALRKALPGIGVYHVRTLTQAKDQARRDNLVFVGLDYIAQSADAEKLVTQVEIAGEALLRSVDRFWSAGGGVYGGAEARQSVTVETVRSTPIKATQHWEAGVRMMVPVQDEDPA